MEEKRVIIIYDGQCFKVFDYDGKRPSYIVDYEIEYRTINNEIFKHIQIPKLKLISMICWNFEVNEMFNDLRTEYISAKEDLKELIYNNL